ncbi:hypothetical protein [Roseiconus lacunae]|uniref:Branched-chain amino acid aminotransferase n=1 Tax=Roseiconus lacunae TaxID=2605694 RepID=A0ABT7PM21_9BACT|nr:hypothetical protein [Roseiconus lacunae]MCD0462707.1 hypothetical protein [Roseiconus lacunae]MDM4017206.1 hypothetical protein [Roseiconus lacunae]
MKATAQKLWNDDAGFVVSIELVLISTICVIGLLTGLTAVRDGVVSELSDTAGAVQDLNQSYSYNGVTGHSASTAGSNFQDSLDFCDSPNDISGQADNCITFDGAPADEF